MQFKKYFFRIAFVGLIALNIVTFTSQAFYTAVVGSLGIAKTAAPLVYKGTKMATKAVVKRFKGKLSKRLAKRAAIKVGSASGKAVPFLGIALVAGGVTWAIYEICEDLKELHELEKAFDPFAIFKPEEEKVCGLPVPSEAQIRKTVLESPELVWNQARDLLPNIQSSMSFNSKILELDYKSMMETWSFGSHLDGIKKKIENQSDEVFKDLKEIYQN